MKHHDRKKWCYSMSHLRLIWLLSDWFTGLVGTYATNKCKEEIVFPSKAWGTCQNRFLGKMICDHTSCCSHTVWSCSHVLLFIRFRSDKKIESRGERILFFGPNTNTNNIRNQNFDRIRIRIIFVFSEWANTNTNNIRAQIFGRIRIRIIFGFRIVPEYEYE